MAEIKIRKATAADIAAVARIYDNIHTCEEKGLARIGWIRGVYPTEKTAREALSRDDLFIEEQDGRAVGCAVINRIQPPAYSGAPWKNCPPDGEIMVLHTLVIDPDEKGCGFGRAFAEFYERYALENGCRYLRIDTNERNTAARAFYKKLGYSEADTVPCTFNGIPSVNLVLLEKKI